MAQESLGLRVKRLLPVAGYGLALAVSVGVWALFATSAYRVVRTASDSLAWYTAQSGAPAANEGRSAKTGR